MMENNNICGQPFEAAFCAILSMKPLFFLFDTSVFDQSLTRRKELKKHKENPQKALTNTHNRYIM